MILVALLAGGCRTPVRPEPELLEQDRRQVTQTLQVFAEALRAKDPEALQGVLMPGLPSDRVVILMTRLAQASWLPRYSGYRLAESPAADVSDRELAEGAVRLKVPATNEAGERLKDLVHLARTRDAWWIRDLELRQPSPGDRVEPPQEVVAAIREELTPLMENLKGGHVWYIWGELPKEGSSRFRRRKKSILLGLFSTKQVVSIHHDLEIVKQLDFISWPDPADPLELEYLGPGAIAACYDLPYSWGTGPQPELLHVEFTFVHKLEGWEFYRVDFSGKVIPK
jgi:hypothetical protein